MCVQATWDLHGLVVYAGADKLACTMESKGRPFAMFDPDQSNIIDVTSSHGFMHAMSLALRVHPTGLCWIAIPGPTWLFNHRAWSGRTSETPEGNCDSPDVAKSNLALARLCLMATVCTSKGCVVVIERPATSIVHHMLATYRAT
jgi:hypothetical protein